MKPQTFPATARERLHGWLDGTYRYVVLRCMECAIPPGLPTLKRDIKELLDA